MSIATNFKRSEQNYTELQVVIPELADNFTENSSNPQKIGVQKNTASYRFPLKTSNPSKVVTHSRGRGWQRDVREVGFSVADGIVDIPHDMSSGKLQVVAGGCWPFGIIMAPCRRTMENPFPTTIRYKSDVELCRTI